MQSLGKDARPVGSAVPYERHRPETTLLYQLVEVHYPVFVAQLATRGTPLPDFEPLDFVARLAALVPRPRVNLTRFHGVFAPNS